MTFIDFFFGESSRIGFSQTWLTNRRAISWGNGNIFAAQKIGYREIEEFTSVKVEMNIQVRCGACAVRRVFDLESDITRY